MPRFRCMRHLDLIRAVFSKILPFLHKPKRAEDVLGRPDCGLSE